MHRRVEEEEEEEEEGGGRRIAAPAWACPSGGWSSTRSGPCPTAAPARPKKLEVVSLAVRRGKPGLASVCGQEAEGGGKMVSCKKMAAVSEGGWRSLRAAFLLRWL